MLTCYFIGGPFDGRTRTNINVEGKRYLVLVDKPTKQDHIYWWVDRRFVRGVEFARVYEYVKETTCRSRS